MTPRKHFVLDPSHTDPARLKRERERAREIRNSPWWKGILAKGVCAYCDGRFKPFELTMDHRVPLARGGESIKSNLVAACRECNQKKGLNTPVDDLFEQLQRERSSRKDLGEDQDE